MRIHTHKRRKLRLHIAGCGTRYSGDIPRDRPLLRNLDGTPLPEDASAIEISHRLLDYWPVWDLQEQLEKQGVVINRVNFRTGWVKMHIDWWRAEKVWKKGLKAEIIRDLVAMAANEQALYFNHWQVIRPKHLDINCWETLNEAAREAVVFLRTELKFGKSVYDLLQHTSLEEVNSIILANSFSLMEKEGKDDRD